MKSFSLPETIEGRIYELSCGDKRQRIGLMVAKERQVVARLAICN